MSAKFFCDCCEKDFPVDNLTLYLIGENKKQKHYCEACRCGLASYGAVNRLAQAREALRKYADHNRTCLADGDRTPCVCGFRTHPAVLAANETEED